MESEREHQMNARKTPISIISFDLDGTLIDDTFVNAIWYEEIPKLYSREKTMPFKKAVTLIKKEYEKIGKERLEWYDLNYWINQFNLKISSIELLTKYSEKIQCYPEAIPVLEKLGNTKLKLIVITNAFKDFAKIELEETGLIKYFDQVFSATSDFKRVKKTVQLYQTICDLLKVTPQEIIHVGDDFIFDFLVPTKAGINAYYLDRSYKKSGTRILRTLEALKTIIKT